jgi:2-polyprenyl-6-methoxyphenol hydroxylase-like FAD-dependent oxidoreductase
LRERLAAAFSGWSAPVSSFIASTETIIRTAIYEVPSLPTWSQDRVVLIGDAAHAMSPAAGQGASLALEDAQLLSHLLRDPSQPLEQTFKHFEQRRKPRTTSIAATARSNDDRALQQLGPVAYWLRDHMFPLFAPLVSRGLEKEYSAAVL